MSSVIPIPEQDDEIRARTLLSKLDLPIEIERIDLAFKNDSDGDPALFLSFVLTCDAKLDKESIPRLSRFMQEVALKFIQSGFPRFPYVSLDEAA